MTKLGQIFRVGCFVQWTSGPGFRYVKILDEEYILDCGGGVRHNANVRLGWFYEKSCESLYCVTSLLWSADSWCACVGWWGTLKMILDYRGLIVWLMRGM